MRPNWEPRRSLPIQIAQDEPVVDGIYNIVDAFQGMIVRANTGKLLLRVNPL